MSTNKQAAVVGAGAAGATGATLTAITAGLSGPAANLGGYATAQIVASATGASSIGLCGPALATIISTVGGPAVFGIAVAGGVGLLAVGGFKLIKRAFF